MNLRWQSLIIEVATNHQRLVISVTSAFGVGKSVDSLQVINDALQTHLDGLAFIVELEHALVETLQIFIYLCSVF